MATENKSKKARPRDAATSTSKVNRTAANKKRRAETRERRLQKIRDAKRHGLTVPQYAAQYPDEVLAARTAKREKQGKAFSNGTYSESEYPSYDVLR